MPVAKYFHREGPMETLVLAERLGMERAAVRHLHPDSYEPHGEASMMGRIQTSDRVGRAPGRTVVHDHTVGKAIATEGVCELFLDRPGPLIGTGPQA